MNSVLMGGISQWNCIAFFAALVLSLNGPSAGAMHHNLPALNHSIASTTWAASAPLPGHFSDAVITSITKHLTSADFSASLNSATSELNCQLLVDDPASFPSGTLIATIQVTDDSSGTSVVYRVLSDGGGIVIALDEF